MDYTTLQGSLDIIERNNKKQSGNLVALKTHIGTNIYEICHKSNHNTSQLRYRRGEHKQGRVNLKRKPFERLSRERREKANDDFTCFCCGNEGHYAQNCPNEKRKGIMLKEKNLY